MHSAAEFRCSGDNSNDSETRTTGSFCKGITGLSHLQSTDALEDVPARR